MNQFRDRVSDLQLRLSRPAFRVPIGIALALFLSLGVYLSYVGALPGEETGKCVESSSVGFPKIYEWVLNRKTHGDMGEHVTLLTIGDLGKERAELLNNVCKQREYLAYLVDELVRQHAAVVVIDKVFGDSCPGDDHGTGLLSRALAQEKSDSQHSSPAMPATAVPIVVGVPTSGWKGACGLRRGKEIFAFTPNVHEGLTRLNKDIRKIPVFWSTGKQSTEKQKAEADKTLSLVAAELAPARWNIDQARLRGLFHGRYHPFARFQDDDESWHWSAWDLHCFEDATELQRYSGLSNQACPPVLPVIEDRIVVIGDDIPGRDRHNWNGEEKAGVYLQASYIQDLLQAAYLQPVAPQIQPIIFVILFVIIWVVFWWKNANIALGICLFVLFSLVIVSLIFVYRGYFVEPWIPIAGLITIVLNYLGGRGLEIVGSSKKGRAREQNAA